MDCQYICADRVLAGRELSLLRDGCIAVMNGKIERILTRQALLGENSGAPCPVLDLGDATLMPGLIECHNHLALDARLPGHLEMMEKSECELTLLALNSLRDDLMSGVTTARCLGDRHYIDVVLRDQIKKGAVTGPNLLVCGIGMRSVHGHGYVGLPHCGAEELRKTARQNMARGADFLKLFVTPGNPPPGGGHIPNYLSFQEIKTVVDEGRNLGLKTAAHCIGGRGLRDCVEAGVEIIEHAYAITDEEIALVKQHGCWVSLTSGIFLDPSREEFCSPDSAALARKVRGQVTERMRSVLSGGVKFAIGTDAFHTFLYREAEFAVELGAEPAAALRAVTSSAAEMCGIAGKTGSLGKGLDADIIAVRGNPLENVSALADVTFVMKNGLVYKSEA